MFTNNRRYISQDDIRDDYINLNLRLSSSERDWSCAIRIMRHRLEGRYLDPMETLVRADVNKNGFAAMALCCLLIETFLQFREGYPRTPNRMNMQCYRDFLAKQMGDIFDVTTAGRFYTDIRCGILHSAQTKNGSCLTFNTDYVVRNQGNDILMVDVQGMLREVKRYFEHYCKELIDVNNTELRTNFIRKMDDITKKRDGSHIIDNLWFAICEKEYKEFERMNDNGRRFSFRVVDNGTALKINENLTITKNNIEDALYFWPNERAIKMMDNWKIILPLLYCHQDIADEIVRRNIA